VDYQSLALKLKRRKSMQKRSTEILTQVQKIIESYDFALSLRQIYYQLVAKQIIPNQIAAYQKLSRLCVMGRDEGLLPEEAFADRLRQVDKQDSWIDLQDFMDTVKGAYRKDQRPDRYSSDMIHHHIFIICYFSW
jgi:hypothetical protein